MSRAAGSVEVAEIIDATPDGRGVAKLSGKAVFVHGALSGETVSFVRRKRRRRYDDAELVDVISPSPGRVAPRCPSFGVCGGCALQHIGVAEQIELKQEVLFDNLERIGRVEPERRLEPLTGPGWGYRRKARLAVKYVTRKERVLVGFRERHKPFVVDMQHCDTLHPRIAGLLPALSAMIADLSILQRLPQIEVAVGDDAAALVFRVLDPPSSPDLTKFAEFADRHDVRVFLQPGDLESIHPLPGRDDPLLLSYRISGFDFSLEFAPSDFVQVNAHINDAIVHYALDLLQPTADERVVDLFCGLGNFSLPFATRAAAVRGVELDHGMIERARHNAERAGLTNASFAQADLMSEGAMPPLNDVELAIIDPPRSGAADVLAPLAAGSVSRILYVSCHPGTLARDAQALVHQHQFRLAAAGVADMFSQTSHVESLALFER